VIRILYIGLLLLLGVAACVTVAVYRSSRTRAPIVARIEPMTENASPIEPPRDAPQWLTVVIPASEVLVTAPVRARIVDVLVDLGDTVEAGQPIAVLDPDVARRSLAEARAQLGARQAERKQAEAVREQKRDNVDRIVKLGSLVAAAERTEAELALTAAQADVDRTSAEVRVQRVLIAELEDQLRDTTIRAPLSGEVSARLLHAGAHVEAGASIVRVIEAARRIRFAVGLESAPPVVGSTVHVHCDAARRTTAVVTHVAPDIDAATRVVLVEAEPADAATLRLGETCTTSLDAE
jgi:RND family efflux transporter MFP subunit